MRTAGAGLDRREALVHVNVVHVHAHAHAHVHAKRHMQKDCWCLS